MVPAVVSEEKKPGCPSSDVLKTDGGVNYRSGDRIILF
jgi:hypothetical protein